MGRHGGHKGDQERSGAMAGLWFGLGVWKGVLGGRVLVTFRVRLLCEGKGEIEVQA